MNAERRKKWRNHGIFALALAAALVGSFQYISSYSSVSGNINGKEMPICSVEMKEKKVALTFDAAWGGGNLRKNDTDMIHSILCRQYLVDVDFSIFG